MFHKTFEIILNAYVTVFWCVNIYCFELFKCIQIRTLGAKYWSNMSHIIIVKHAVEFLINFQMF